MQQLRVGHQWHWHVLEVDDNFDLRSIFTARCIECPHARDEIFCVDSFQLGLGHFTEVAEPPDDLLQIANLHAKRLRALAEYLVELRSRQLPGPRQILYR